MYWGSQGRPRGCHIFVTARRVDAPLLWKKDESVIFYCGCPYDEGATKQAKKYQREGFSNVKVLVGGVNAWKNAGYGLVEARA